MSISTYAKHMSTKQTPQSEAIPGKDMVANSAGGFSFGVDCWTRLDRFLILGSSGGSYYASEQKLTKENASGVLECAKADYRKAVARIAEISDAGRAPKNDPAIFALALIASFGSDEARKEALSAVNKVCRIGTHIFQFAATCNEMRGWGRGLCKAIANWYTAKEPAALAYQMLKYQQREGWSHADLLRLSHVKSKASREITGHTKKGHPIYANGPAASIQDEIYRWTLKGWHYQGQEVPEELQRIWAFEDLKNSKDKAKAVHYISQYGLTREMLPTELLNEPEIWEALLEGMPATALIRNLATMTRIGLIAPMSDGTRTVIAKLNNADWLKKSRVHPLAILVAMSIYRQGRGDKSDKTWSPVSQIIDALDGAFYKAFANVEATNKRWFLALDISGSMTICNIAGAPGITPRIGSAAMALVTAAVEPQHHFVGFTSNGWQCSAAGKGQWASQGMNNGISPIAISPRQRLTDVCDAVGRLPMGGTDCALPMLYAAEQKIPVDMFCIYTDLETWHGAIHPCQALNQYRQKMGIPAKLVVIGMVSNNFTIADPNDRGMLDVVGFDTAVPQIMNQFALED